MASTSSTATRQQKFNVFLSFRGADTRDGFVSHLHAALLRNQIETFIDERLEGGEDISPALLEKIVESHISVVIFSKNYADSPWCLEELVKILECKETLGQMVLPVFYKVNPTHVQELSDSYGDALAEHQRKSSPEKVNGWRRALTEIANLKGWDSNNIKPETKLIEEIVRDIWSKLLSETSSDFPGLFGIGSRSNEVELLLCVGAPGVLIVGIWGMGGMGKTTLAEVIYNKISAQFEGQFFLTNIRQELERSTIVALRNKILTAILGIDMMSIGTLGLPMHVKRMLQRKKVLIVLDDVSSHQQLKKLLGEDVLLGDGSRVLVTSRDKQVFGNKTVSIYEVKGLEDHEAVQLFRLHAFRQQECPTEEHMRLAKMVVECAEGNPLALKVLGSNLYDKEAEEWNSELEKLQATPDMEIQNILRISYDGLERTEKSIFLDIACFFRNCSKDLIEEILNRGGFFATSGLRRLSDKCLIDISGGMIRMHDLLQKLGRDIVCLECINDPRKRSRLWNPDDICHVLTHDKGTKTVEAISLNMSKIRQLKISRTALEKMRNLRLLKFYYPFHDIRKYKESRILCPEDMEFLSDKLRVLHWDRCPLKSLPSNFCPKNLVELRMRGSPLTNLSGFPCLENLKLIDFTECKNLVEVPPSVVCCSKLKELDLNSCINLRCLPSLVHLTSLESVHLAGCAKFEEFPEVPLKIQTLNLSGTAIKQVPSSIGHLSQLSELDLTECNRLEGVHSSIGQLKRLERLRVSRCDTYDVRSDSLATLAFDGYENLPDHQLAGLESPVGHYISIRNILYSFASHSASLYDLYLVGCGISEIPDILGSLVSVSTLDLSSNDFKSIPASIKQLSNLTVLCLWECGRLQCLPELPSSLEELDVHLCSSLRSLMLNPLEHLTSIDLSWCENLVEVPRSVGYCSKLISLSLVYCGNLSCLPSLLHLTSLESLHLNGCAKIEEFPEVPVNIQKLNLSGTAIKQVPSSIGHLSQLSELDLTECNRLEGVHSSIGQLKRLERLRVSRCDTYDVRSDSLATLAFDGYENLPDHQLAGLESPVGHYISIRNILYSFASHSASLYDLYLVGCGISEIPDILGSLVSVSILDLSGNDFKSIPASIKQLSNLKVLNLMECRRLQCLPELPSSLEELDVSHCSSLRSIMSNPLEHLTTIDLNWCENLVEVPPSVGYCSKLIRLSLMYCGNLRCLPSLLHLTSLESLDLKRCAKFEEFPEVPVNIQKLNLSGTAIKQVPSSIGHLSQLSQLDLTRCKRLESVHSSIFQLKRLERLRVSRWDMYDVRSDSLATLAFDRYENLPDHQLAGLESPVGHYISIRYILYSFASHSGSLYDLYLVGCGISEIPDILGSLVSVSTLDLSRNDFKSIPASIKQLSNLKVLNLRCCRRLQCLPELPSSLEELDVSDCSSLRSIMSNPRLENLKLIKLRKCKNLIEVPPFVVCCCKLKKLDLDSCINLRCLPSLLHLTSLESLYLAGCAKIEEFPEVPLNIQKLNLSGTAIKQVPSSIGHLSQLSKLDLTKCKRLESVHSSIGQLKSLESFSVDRGGKYDLISNSPATLVFDGCENLTDHQLEDLGSPMGHHISIRNILSSLTSHLGSLDDLHLVGCGISEIPDTLGSLVSLSTLDLSKNDFKSIPASIKQLSNLVFLYLRKCRRLQCLPELSLRLKLLDVSHCSSLRPFMLNPLEHLTEMDLSWCENLVEVPPSVGYCSKLRELNLGDCGNLRCLPSLLHLTSLEYLYLNGCAKIEEFPEVPLNIQTLNLSGTAIKQVPSSIGHLSQLSQLDLTECKRLESVHSSIGQLKRLKWLSVGRGGIHDVRSDSPATLVFYGSENLPDQQLEDLESPVVLRNILPFLTSHLSSLSLLCLVGCGISEIPDTLTSLVSLELLDLSRNDFKCIPASIKQLSNLERLCLTECRNLQCLPELPSTLEELDVSHCGSLKSVHVTLPGSLESLRFDHCYCLDENSCFEIIADLQSRMQRIATENYYCRSIAAFCIPGNEVPKWFSYKNTEGSSLQINESSRFYNNNWLLGCIFCAIVAPKELQDFEHDWGNHEFSYVSCDCHFITESGCHNLQLDKKQAIKRIDKPHVFIWYESMYSSNYFFEKASKLDFCWTISGLLQGLQVIKCGVLPVLT